ncbi:hypothetical protein D3C72_952700 [compost metagenome]
MRALSSKLRMSVPACTCTDSDAIRFRSLMEPVAAYKRLGVKSCTCIGSTSGLSNSSMPLRLLVRNVFVTEKPP